MYLLIHALTSAAHPKTSELCLGWVITNLFCNFNGDLAKPSLKSGHGLLITSEKLSDSCDESTLDMTIYEKIR